MSALFGCRSVALPDPSVEARQAPTSRVIGAPSVRRDVSVGAAVDSAARALQARDTVPGMSVTVVEEGKRTLTQAYGFADRARAIPMSDTTPLNIASVSKFLTAVAAMRLVAAGTLQLDNPVLAKIHGWAPADTTYSKTGVTVRRLLHHTAGMGMPSVPCPPLAAPRPATASALRGDIGDKGALRMERAPGSAWAYSGGGFTLLQLVMEEATNETFQQVMQRLVFAPLGMSHATSDPDSNVIARPYDPEDRRLAPDRCVGEAAGGLYLSARDAAAFIEGYLHDDESFLNAGWRDTMLVDPVEVTLPGIDVGGARYGAGQFTWRSPEGDVLVYHSGGNPGAIAYLAINITRRSGLFVAANSERGAGALRELISIWARRQGFTAPAVF